MCVHSFSFALPDFTMPLPDYGTSPAMDSAEQDMWDWLDRNSLVANQAMREHLVRTRPFYTTARYFPSADLQHLVGPTRYTALAFIIDPRIRRRAVDLDDQGPRKSTGTQRHSFDTVKF